MSFFLKIQVCHAKIHTTSCHAKFMSHVCHFMPLSCHASYSCHTILCFHFVPLFFHAVSYHAISCHYFFHATSCHAIFSLIFSSCHVMPCHDMNFFIMSCHATLFSCEIMSCEFHVISFFFMSSHFMPFFYHVMACVQ